MLIIRGFFEKVIFVIKKILKGILWFYLGLFGLIGIVILFGGLFSGIKEVAFISFFILCIIGCYFYIIFYYKSKKFLDIKNSISKNTEDCNNLNRHIEELKNSYVNIKKWIMVVRIMLMLAIGIIKEKN